MVDDVLDYIYGKMDWLMRENMIAEIDSWLGKQVALWRSSNKVRTDRDVTYALAYLTASLPMKSRLSQRKIFFQEINDSLNNHPERDALLEGLE